MKILISYRREDSPDVTGRIYDRLRRQFGRDSVFKDVDSIPLGVDFRTYLDEQVAKCHVFLAVIGRDWMKTKGGKGKSRLEDPGDFVRIEIESALKREIPLIPVLVRGAKVPAADRLPESLRDLAYRNGIAVRTDPDFHGDMNRLIKHLKQQIQLSHEHRAEEDTAVQTAGEDVKKPSPTQGQRSSRGKQGLNQSAGTQPARPRVETASGSDQAPNNESLGVAVSITSPGRSKAGPTLFLLGSSGSDAQALNLVATCVIVDDKASLTSQLETIGRAMLQDPYFGRDDDLRQRLVDGGLPFDSGDPAIRLRMLTGLSDVTFEAYVCYGEKVALSRRVRGDTLDGVLARLLFERIQARKHDRIAIEIDQSLADRVDSVTKGASTIVRKLSEGNTPAIAVPTVERQEKRGGIADYIASVVAGRLAGKASDDARAFDRLRPKIRVMHDYGTDVFYTRKNPFGE